MLQRRTTGRPAPYRRPPALNSFQAEPAAEPGTPASWDAFAATGAASNADATRTADAPQPAWDTPPDDRGALPARRTDSVPRPRPEPDAPANPPPFRPVRREALADARTGSGRASFGVTGGPISGARPEPVSPAGPRPAASGRGATDLPMVTDRREPGDVPPPGDMRSTGGFAVPVDLRSTTGSGDLRSAGGFGDLPSAGGFGDLRSTTGSGDLRSTGGFPVPGDLGSTGGFAVPADLRSTGDHRATADRRSRDVAPHPDLRDLPGDHDDPVAPGDSAGIGDLMNGPGREIRPHRAGEAPGLGENRRSRLVTAATVLLSSVVLLGGVAAGVVFFAGENESLTSVLQLGSAGTDSKVATAALGGRTTASFELIAATSKVTVRTQDLGEELFRITSAGDSGTAPSPVLTGDRVQLLLSPDGEGASGNVEVLLSAKVTWGLRFGGGTDEQVVDFTGGKVSSIDVVGGSRRVDLRLSQPTGTVPVRVTGAVDELSLTSPAGSPVRVKVDSGAKTVAAGTTTLRDVRPGSTLTPKDWKAPNRYDVDAASRVTLLTVRNTP